MIATGNHNFERFAALCNTLGGSQGVLTFSVYALVGVDEYVDPSAALPPQMYRIPDNQLHSNPTMIAPSSA